MSEVRLVNSECLCKNTELKRCIATEVGIRRNNKELSLTSPVIDAARVVYMESRVYETVRCPAGRLSVPTAANPLLQVCCCGPGGHGISINCCSSGVQLANAGSATLSAYAGS